MHLIDASDKRNMLYVSQEVFDCMQRIPPIDPESLIQYHVAELSRTFHYRVVKDEPKKHGEWKYFYGNRGQCSVCGVVVSSTVRNNGNYCPNCGAKMKGGTA